MTQGALHGATCFLLFDFDVLHFCAVKALDSSIGWLHWEKLKDWLHRIA